MKIPFRIGLRRLRVIRCFRFSVTVAIRDWAGCCGSCHNAAHRPEDRRQRRRTQKKHG